MVFRRRGGVGRGTLDGMWSLTQPVSGLDDAHILIDSGKATVLTNQEGDVKTNTGAVKTRTNWTPWHQKTVRGKLTLPANLLGTKTWSYEKTPLGELTLRAPKKKVLVFVRDALASLA